MQSTHIYLARMHRGCGCSCMYPYVWMHMHIYASYRYTNLYACTSNRTRRLTTHEHTHTHIYVRTYIYIAESDADVKGPVNQASFIKRQIRDVVSFDKDRRLLLHAFWGPLTRCVPSTASLLSSIPACICSHMFRTCREHVQNFLV